MNKAYKIVMSRGDDIQIDSQELQVVISGIQSGNPVIVRSGIFNPSFYVSIVKDSKRHSEFLDEIKYEEKDSPLRLSGVKPLKDIFKETPLKLN